MSNPTTHGGGTAAETAAPYRPASSQNTGNNSNQLPLSAIQDMDPILVNHLNTLPYAEQVAFVSEYDSKKKTVVLGYVCWFIMGVQYAYLGKWGMQALYWLTLGGLGMWTVIDLFRIPGMVKKYNREMGLKMVRMQ